jgi:hypothetical protein
MVTNLQSVTVLCHGGAARRGAGRSGGQDEVSPTDRQQADGCDDHSSPTRRRRRDVDGDGQSWDVAEG